MRYTCSKDVASEFLGQVVWIWQLPDLFLAGGWQALPEKKKTKILFSIVIPSSNNPDFKTMMKKTFEDILEK